MSDSDVVALVVVMSLVSFFLGIGIGCNERNNEVVADVQAGQIILKSVEYECKPTKAIVGDAKLDIRRGPE